MPGEIGNVHITTLNNYAMPLIRYDIGDMGVESDDECPCGRKLPLMKVIEGRSDSNLILPSGRILSPRAFTVAINMFPEYGLFDQYRIIQRKVDHFVLMIKTKGKRVDDTAVSNNIVNHLNRTLNLESEMINFEVRFVDEIPVSKTGKLMIVVSEVNKLLHEV